MTDENLNKKIKYLVADTTAFLNAVPLNEYAENVLTVPDVINEVRNKRQIRRLCVLPFDLQVREPRVESVRHCVAFAKKTGDYASLSGIDLKVISLTYELEAENVGTDHLRKEPVMAQTIASRDKPLELQDNTKLPGWYESKNGAESSDEENSENEIEDDSEEEEEKNNSSSEQNEEHHKEAEKSEIAKDNIKQDIEKILSEKSDDVAGEKPDYTDEELDRAFEGLNCTDNVNYEDILKPTENNEDATSEDDNHDDKLIEQGSEELNDDGWITPSNIKQAKKSLEGKIEEDRIPLVSCMSTDFALQNVLKQLNLNISALNGRVIKQLRTYILRCYACYNTTSIMTKVFCPRCGNKTLKRVAVSLDENGKQVIHINTRRPLTAKYKNQSLPHFRGGKHSRNPIIFEDQPIPRQMPSRVAKTKTNALEEDYIAGMSPFVMRDVDSKSAMLRAKGNLKEWARNNNFEEDRRRKNYNRLYK